jgi:hypothetical protein
MTAPTKAKKNGKPSRNRGRSRVEVLKIRVSTGELAAWRRAAWATSEGNVSRYVREVMNAAITKPREPAEVS